MSVPERLGQDGSVGASLSEPTGVVTRRGIKDYVVTGGEPLVLLSTRRSGGPLAPNVQSILHGVVQVGVGQQDTGHGSTPETNRQEALLRVLFLLRHCRLPVLF